jgi:DNA helicase-2/ATP-dependent DNA helicase PcrA
MTPSKYQEVIYEFIQFDSQSGQIKAVAGSGKTTTIVQGSNLVPLNLRAAFLAFNKPVADKLKSVLPQHVPSSTFNSLGCRTWYRYNRGCATDEFKMDKILKEVIERPETRQVYGGLVKKLVGLAKAHGMVPEPVKDQYWPLHEMDWEGLIDSYGVGDDLAEEGRLVKFASDCLVRSLEMADRVVDFDDQIYMPIVAGCLWDQFDIMFVDEAQDVNEVQRAMIMGCCEGRIIAVGDPRQAIYAFRGARSDSMDLFRDEFWCKELPLSICYRCPVCVVKEAKQIVPEIEWAPWAIEGEVRWEGKVGEVLQGDGFVCRLNAPVIDVAYGLIRRGLGAKVLGKEIGRGLIRLIEKMDSGSLEELRRGLDSYKAKEVQKFRTQGRMDRAESVADRVNCLEAIIDGMLEGERTIARLVRDVNGMFSDEGDAPIQLSTIHKAKGLEYRRVFYLQTKDWRGSGEQAKQEINLRYVAITRAKEELIYVTLT